MYVTLSDFPTKLEFSNGLHASFAWKEFYNIASSFNLKRTQFNPLYITFRTQPDDCYEHLDKKKARTSFVLYKNKQIPSEIHMSFTTLSDKLKALPEGTSVICTGQYALLFLMDEPSLMRWRGSWFIPKAFPHLRVLPTLHPETALAKYEYFSLIASDLERFAKGYKEFKEDYNIIVPLTAKQAIEVIRDLPSNTLNSLDIETFRKHISCIGFAWTNKDALVIPFSKVDGTTVTSVYAPQDELEIRHAIRHHLEKTTFVGQNFLFDLFFLFREFAHFPKTFYDTMIAAHVLSPVQKKDLATLCSLYLDDYRFWKDDKKGEEGTENLTFAGSPNLWKYNAQDCCRTLELHYKLKEELTRENLLKQAEEQYQAAHVLFRMMMTGVKINTEVRSALTNMLLSRTLECDTYIQSALGESINVSSPKQLQDLFYTRLKLPVQIHPKRKTPSTEAEALENLCKHEPLIKPIVKRINYIRSSQLLVASANSLSTPTNRWHCSYKPTGTETFRLSSSTNPYGEAMNLQNLTKGTKPQKHWLDEVPNMRRIIVPDPDFIFYDGDLQKADVHFVAWEANDEVLKEWLRKGLDTHKMAAQEIFNVSSIDKVTDEQRQLAKAGVHATNYGVSAYTLSRTLGITKHAAEKFINRWLQAHPQIKDWQERITFELQSTRIVRNIYGYRIKWLGRIDYHAIHAALAWGPQSSVAIYTRNIMIALQKLIDEHKAYNEIQLLLQTHDSLNWQIHKDHVEKWERRIKLLAQEQVAPYADPLTIGVDLVRKKESWGV